MKRQEIDRIQLEQNISQIVQKTENLQFSAKISFFVYCSFHIQKHLILHALAISL